MQKGRLEAFSDGVLAIVITIMVLEMKVPDEANLAALEPIIPVFISYVISFIYLGIYWNNHHHLLQISTQINGHILWANLHLLFWLSLIPFATGWIGENNFATLPVVLYGVILFFAAIAYRILTIALIRHHGQNSPLAKAMANDTKGNISLASYVIAIPLSFVNPLLSFGLYILVAAIWFIPDRRIERITNS
ncbi:protein of unknown function DUF1211 [Thalassoporum mexicanum PCC 7367]|uniref:TMEM175 family protein n=1 Tax=Thalassoporum mexicanum TaxID=3457544 RepID=UPI00029FA0F1|nr:TMEM175 family protein [Pseudanabaena sp. PCC 7367]AFY69869.1 protein of unknown function DUF1211 [Pseudanabaena sp. PCC 7367]